MKKSSLIVAATLTAVATAAGVKQLSVPDIEASQKSVFRGFDELSRLNAYVVADNGDKLGSIGSKYGSDSLASSYGKGSTYASDGLFNTSSKYGNKYSNTSAFNSSASKPPMILANRNGKVYTIGYLTTNPYISTSGQRISPHMLKAWIDSQ